ncbi:Tol-Pal system beta propeller repeat protein TolB [Paracoccus sp. p4-l81]|uniref:Tol-Pal system beta propeller repeat protein TolB n=1 Tax=unclassified Paracoccus (in: a-proteobacteria) TaxID=2688777 RepID=UPI0035B748DF
MRCAFPLILSALMALPMAAPAQQAPGPLRIEITDGVIEPMPFALPVFFGQGEMAAKISKVVSDDLTGTGLFREIDRSAYVAAPASFEAPVVYEDWKAINAQALITGEVVESGGTVDVRFRLFDVYSGQPMGDGLQFTAGSGDWRRLGHKVADAVYGRITGEGPYFDSRVVFVGESGPKNARQKRIGVMDYDGANIRWLTDSAALVLNPRFSPDGNRIAFTSYESGVPQIKVLDVGAVSSAPVTTRAGTMAFSPRFSPNGRQLAFSREENGNTDIFVADIAGGGERQLTNAPSIETSPSFSPDGSRIVFESDRSGTQQLYVMSANGGEPTRISFGDGRYGSPAWSPKGDLIAFTKQTGGQFHIGVMRVDGSDERVLTSSFMDEGPTWAPNGRVVMFTRVTPGEAGVPRLHSVDITGRNMRPVTLDGPASDPGWSPLLP